MKYCSSCGSSVDYLVPAGDNRPRHVCNDCGTIHYSNPNNVCGAILTHGDEVLLCRRAIEPRYGLWTLPAGFMENGETIAEAAARECLEEANARANSLHLFGVFSLPHISQVYLMFRGELASKDFHAGDESLEVALFDQAGIPWDELAFPVIGHSLRLYFNGLASGRNDGVHVATAVRKPDMSVDWID